MMIKKALLGLSVICLSTATTQAVIVYGLTTTNGLVSFESSLPSAVTNIGTISQAGIVDIDFFPVNGLLYGITSNGATYSISLTNAVATFLFNPLTVLSGITDMDFNPQVDRMRLFGTTDQNYRMVPNTTTAPSTSGTAGTVTADGTFSNTSVNLVGSAYTNNFDGASSTSLYSIDSAGSTLILHSVPTAFNTVTPVGNLGFTVGTNVGFDIDLSGNAYLTDGDNFYSVNLTSGSATSLGSIATVGSDLVSIAVPEPGTWAVLLAGMAALFAFTKMRKTAVAKI